MKRILSIIFILSCLCLLVACNSDGTAVLNDEWDTQNPYFTGKVIEVYENGCFLEVTDIGNGNFRVGNKVQVHTDIPTCPKYAVGDFLRISFDGKVAKSYPPQVTNVFSIIKTDENGNRVE